MKRFVLLTLFVVSGAIAVACQPTPPAANQPTQVASPVPSWLSAVVHPNLNWTESELRYQPRIAQPAAIPAPALPPVALSELMQKANAAIPKGKTTFAKREKKAVAILFPTEP